MLSPFSYRIPLRKSSSMTDDAFVVMRTRTLITALLLATALAAATVARAAVTVNTVISGGGTLNVTTLNAPSFPVTLNGDDQTASYQAQLQIVDSRGLAVGGGWHLTMTSTQYNDLPAGHTLPTTASTISSVTSGCHAATSTCQIPTNAISNTNLAVPISPSTTTILNAATATGLGRIDVNVNVNVGIPASTIAASYSSTLTFAVVAGP